MAWTDFHGLSPEETRSAITMLRDSAVSGAFTEISIAGVRTVAANGEGQPSAAMRLQDAQEYYWQIMENGHDYTAVIRPSHYRNRTTRCIAS